MGAVAISGYYLSIMRELKSLVKETNRIFFRFLTVKSDTGRLPRRFAPRNDRKDGRLSYQSNQPNKLKFEIDFED